MVGCGSIRPCGQDLAVFFFYRGQIWLPPPTRSGCDRLDLAFSKPGCEGVGRLHGGVAQIFFFLSRPDLAAIDMEKARSSLSRSDLATTKKNCQIFAVWPDLVMASHILPPYDRIWLVGSQIRPPHSWMWPAMARFGLGRPLMAGTSICD